MAASAVHPHTCGELYVAANAKHKFDGSSPHMWGTLIRQFRERGKNRFIPTHVGNSASGCFLILLTAVHPHTCGELHMNLQEITATPGSSPHMWGTLHYGLQYQLNRRFIPTHVGNSEYPVSTGISKTVHPHTCGELFTTVYNTN